MFNQYPYINENDLNLDFILKRLRVLKQMVENFINLETMKFADPILWNITTQYQKGTIVIDTQGNAYVSKKIVPAGVELNDEEYWLVIFNFMDYVKTFNSNLTFNIESNTSRATAAYSVDDWLLWDDVLYKVVSPIAIDDILDNSSGGNLERFTVELFCKAWIYNSTQIINQYKIDIDASELSFTQNLQEQFDQVLAGATVDSEVINARVGWDGEQFSTLKNAITGQITQLRSLLSDYFFNDKMDDTALFANKYIQNDGTLDDSTSYSTTDFIAMEDGEVILANHPRVIATYDSNKSLIFRYSYVPADYNYDKTALVAAPIGGGYVRITFYNTDIADDKQFAVIPKTFAKVANIKRELANDFDLLPLGVFVENYYYNQFDSQIGSNEYSYYKVPIVNGHTYTAYPAARFVIQKDDQFHLVDNTLTSNSHTPYTFTAVTDGYAYITYYNNTINNAALYERSYNSGIEIFGNKRYIFNDVLPMDCTIYGRLRGVLCGLKILGVGDSIMEGSANGGVGIPDILGSKYNIRRSNYAVGGATMGYNINTTQIYSQIEQAHTDGIEADIILVNGGTNDINGVTPNCPIGTFSTSFSDPATINTFTEGMDKCFYLIRNYWPRAIVLYIRDHNMASRDEQRQIDYGNRAIEVCNKWGIRVIDIFNIMNTQLAWFETEYLVDTTHPNQNGYDTFYIPEIESSLYEHRNSIKYYR